MQKEKATAGYEENKTDITKFIAELEPDRKALVEYAIEKNILRMLNDGFDYSRLFRLLKLKEKLDAGILALSKKDPFLRSNLFNKYF